MKSANHGCWIKVFEDETKEQGLDTDIQAGKASWSKGKLDQIKEVLLYDGYSASSLAVSNTNWYQFDRYTCPVSVGPQPSHRIYRVIQAEIQQSHLDQYIIGSVISSNLYWATITKNLDGHKYEKQITEEDIGKWISIVMEQSKRPIVTLSVKGKI